MLNISQIKKQFPIFSHKINGKPIVFLDSASSTQKPKIVIDTLKNYYETSYANIHRGIYSLSEKSTESYEQCRETVAKFINAKSSKEIIFTKNTTESINLVATSFGNTFVNENDEIIVSVLEHHSNLVSWQELAKRKQAKLRIIPLKNDLTLDFEVYKKLLTKKTKLVALTAMSNVTGTVVAVEKFIKEAKKYGAKTLIDGAQSVPHMKTDVRKMDCDFLAFSGHKMLGPTGIGVLYGKEEILNKMPPFLYGGDMINEVKQFKSTYAELPWKFEAGTPNIADVIAFEKAVKFIQSIGFVKIEQHEKKLLKYAKEKLSKYKEVKLYTPKNEADAGGILSFTVAGIHPHDLATVFNEDNVCIRVGQHCAAPLMDALKLTAVNRMSFYLYNDFKDIDQAEKSLKKALKLFK
ncbi:MAG: SufS family cysteine desulfurase [Candidatus Gracilibacteria bacterium]|jgi:cysteine desulfurase/selenocysteine lyase